MDPDKIGELNTATQLHVTTIGRRTGKPHRVQIAFIYREKRFIMASERGWKADWLQNIAVDPIVALEVAGLKL
ncbi:MAG: nitroreductase/quinone reductase family protein, partial [Nitrososphaerales archaeon]